MRGPATSTNNSSVVNMVSSLVGEVDLDSVKDTVMAKGAQLTSLASAWIGDISQRYT